jgi:uncharacterized protein YbjT (DUF2867 family)
VEQGNPHERTFEDFGSGRTGSIGRHVVEQAILRGHAVRALVRSASKAQELLREVETAIGDLTRPETLSGSVEGIDCVVFTHGSDGGGTADSESVDYGGVRNILAVLGSRKARIALMTAIGVTNRNSSYNKSTEVHDWTRRSERHVRASGREYTIVRPGWFDYNKPDELKFVFLQGDKRHTDTPKDSAISRRQIAQVLISSLTSDNALAKTFELIASKGPAQEDLEPLFKTLDADGRRSLNATHDPANQPLDGEPQSVRDDLGAISATLRASNH